jgi:hypothetical protein
MLLHMLLLIAYILACFFVYSWGALNLYMCICIQIHITCMHTFRGGFFLFSCDTCGIYLFVNSILQIRVLSSNTKKGEIERTFSSNHVLCVS